MNGPRFEDLFCGTVSELRRVLDYNGVTNVRIHNAKSVTLEELPKPFELDYGFYTIGFHWSLEHFFEEVLALIGKTGIAVFTVTPNFEPFSRLLQLPHRLIQDPNRRTYREAIGFRTDWFPDGKLAFADLPAAALHAAFPVRDERTVAIRPRRDTEAGSYVRDAPDVPAKLVSKFRSCGARPSRRRSSNFTAGRRAQSRKR